MSGFDVQDVKGDGGCYYRCLSLYFTGSEGNYMKYRREVMDYIRENLVRKTRTRNDKETIVGNEMFPSLYRTTTPP